MELRIPPDIVALLVGALMWVVASITPSVALGREIRVPVGLLLAVAGMVLIVAARIAFSRAATTFSPRSPDAAHALVTSGVYRHTRNPMYLGTWLVLLGWGVSLSSVWATFASLLFVIYIDRFQIAPEEQALAARFGSDFGDYTRRVKRWV